MPNWIPIPIQLNWIKFRTFSSDVVRLHCCIDDHYRWIHQLRIVPQSPYRVLCFFDSCFSVDLVVAVRRKIDWFIFYVQKCSIQLNVFFFFFLTQKLSRWFCCCGGCCCCCCGCCCCGCRSCCFRNVLRWSVDTLVIFFCRMFTSCTTSVGKKPDRFVPRT